MICARFNTKAATIHVSLYNALQFEYTAEQEVDGEALVMLHKCESTEHCGFSTIKSQMKFKKAMFLVTDHEAAESSNCKVEYVNKKVQWVAQADKGRATLLKNKDVYSNYQPSSYENYGK